MFTRFMLHEFLNSHLSIYCPAKTIQMAVGRGSIRTQQALFCSEIHSCETKANNYHIIAQKWRPKSITFIDALSMMSLIVQK